MWCRLARVHVRAGDRVAAGQVVAELDPGQVEEEVRGAEAAARRAEAEVRKARVDVEDERRKLALQRRAVQSGVAPVSAVEEAELAVKRAVAARESAAQDAMAARSRAKTARGRLGDTRLAAPFDGTVALRFRDAGAIVEASAPIMKIVKQGPLRLRFAVPPRRALALSPGSGVVAAVDTIASPVRATIRRVSPALDPASEMIIVEAELAVDPGVAADLRPGLAAQVVAAP
jgi:RND family efflux transporter MFP subunit